METPAHEAVPVVQSIPVEYIQTSKYQARKDFDEEGIKSLAESIDREGLIQPISVRRVGEAYELVAGERRLRAVKLLGRSAINALVVVVVSEAESAAKGLIENLQRKDLDPIEEAEGIQMMLDLKDSYWTQEQIGKVLGKSQSEISRILRFLGLPEKIKDIMRRRIMTEGHAVELLRLPTPALQDKVAAQIEKKGLGVMQTRDRVGQLLNKATKKAGAAGQKDGEPEVLFKFSGKPMSAWINFSGRYPIIDNFDSFVSKLKIAYDTWRAKDIKTRQEG